MNLFLIIVFTISALWKGGYSNTTWLFAGAVAAAALLFTLHKRPSTAVLALWGGVILLYALSTTVHGATRETLIAAYKPIAAFLWFILLQQRKCNLGKALLISGTAIAGVGIVSFALNLVGVQVGLGIIEKGRLYGTFQYANSYALYLAVCGFLGIQQLTKEKCKLQIAAISVIHIALLLTLSVGAIGTYALGWLLWLWKSNRKWFKWFIAALPVVGVVGFAIVGLRPLSTFLDRLLQISDALNAAVHNPLGIGPGRWYFEVYERQSAFYASRVIHSGYTEIAAEAGIPALALCLALIALYFRREAFSANKIAVLMILIHAVFDFSLSFFSIVLALVALAGTGTFETKPTKQKRYYRIAFVLPVLLIGFIANRQSTELMPHEQYRVISEKALRDNNMKQATEAALLSIKKAPYQSITYEWANALTTVLKDDEKEAFIAQVSMLELQAAERQNPLADLAQQTKQKYLLTGGK
jgi:hypothetical protein